MFVECRLSYEKLKNTIENLISKGVDEFLIGTHGEFDKMCLLACISLKKVYSNIKIFKVYSSISKILKEPKIKHIENVCFNIEQFHYKQRIKKSNEFMIDKADIIVCYVDENLNHSGAKTSFVYAKKKNKKIINLYWQTQLNIVKCNRTLTRVMRKLQR